MTIVTISLNDLPKRPPRGFDADKANALLAAATAAPDSGASDGVAYVSDAEARKIAAQSKRLLANVAPAGQVVKTRVFPVKGGFGWAIFLAAAPADKPAPAKKGAK